LSVGRGREVLVQAQQISGKCGRGRGSGLYDFLAWLQETLSVALLASVRTDS